MNIEKYNKFIPKCMSGLKSDCISLSTDKYIYCPNCLQAIQLREIFTNHEELKEASLTYLDQSESTKANEPIRAKLRYYATEEL